MSKTGLKNGLTFFQETYNNILNCDYTLDEPEFADISDEAKDFIARLLVVDQNNRMSADEALKHPWLAQSPRSFKNRIMPVNSRGLNRVMSRLKWQKCTNVILAVSRFKQSLSSPSKVE